MPVSGGRGQGRGGGVRMPNYRLARIVDLG